MVYSIRLKVSALRNFFVVECLGMWINLNSVMKIKRKENFK